jgi:hypothetical protein
LDIDAAAGNIANFIKHCNEEVKMIAGATGHNDIHRLVKGDLRALTLETSRIAGVKLAGE